MQVILFILLVLFTGMIGSMVFSISISLAIDTEMLNQANLDDPRISITYMLFSQVFSFLLSFLLFLRLTGERFSDLVHMQSIKLKPLLITLGILVLCFLAFPLFEYINEPLRSLLPHDFLEKEILIDRQNELLFVQSDPIQFAFSLVVVALLPAIFEELVFRGFLIKKMLQSGLSEYGAILMSATIFSLTHLQPMKFLAMFTLGAALGFIYLRFRNLKYSMILHFLFNGTQITMAFLAGSGLPYIDI